MREANTAWGYVLGGLLAAATLVVARPAMAADPVVQPPFDDDYFVASLGKIPGVHEPYGALSFGLGTANQIIVGGFTGSTIGLVYVAGLTRDATGSISGFAGTAAALTEAYAIGGGAAYGPDDVLFYSRVTDEMGEVKYESTTTDKVVGLLSAYEPRPSGLNFVPPGFPGAGQLKITTFYNPGNWWSLDIEPDGMGTYDVTGATRGPALPGYPEGFTYVPAGLPGFPNPSVVVCEFANAYGIGKLTAYDVDQNGNPVLATRREIVTGLDVPYGIATDPLTGDLLWTSYQGFVFLLRKAPVPTTTTAPPTTTTIPTTTTSTTKAPTTTTSSTLRPTTSSTAAPTTTTSTTTTKPPTTVPSTTTTSTTKAPTTTTSTTLRPTTTSTTAPPTTTSTTTPPTTTSSTIRPTTSSTSTVPTTTSSSTTSTTIASGCASGPGFPSLACRIDELLDVVRASSVLGPLQSGFVARFERAQQTIAEGAEQCTAGQRTSARAALDRLERQMILIRSRTRTHRARKIIPADLAAAITDGARSVGTDAHTLRGTLTCP